MPEPGADTDTIAAPATPPGRGGVGVIRISGPSAPVVAAAICGGIPPPRTAVYRTFSDHLGQPIDNGIALYFPAPLSFTGEDVCELQAHGAPVIMELLLQAAIAAGARVARPGEFSERAFLNGRIDLAQAEAIADLIESGSVYAARSALRSLQGEFSRRVDQLLDELIELRCFVEACIDFPEEEVDFLADSDLSQRMLALRARVSDVFDSARRGAVLREGMHIVLAGRPNAGKSSLLNCLSGRDSAIVSARPGTTRDVIREYVHLDGLPLHLADTAGLRDSPDEVEREGIHRALVEAGRADRMLLIHDSTSAEDIEQLIEQHLAPLGKDMPPITVVLNKCDLSGLEPGIQAGTGLHPAVAVSARTGAGIEALQEHLKHCMAYDSAAVEFSARPRHVDALQRTYTELESGLETLNSTGAPELLAEHLRNAQSSLGEITGRFGADDLLGRIFSSFCIGK